MSGKTKTWLIAGTPLAILLPASFILGSLLHLQGKELWILRSVFALLGLGVGGAILWYYLPKVAAAAAAAGRTEVDELEDLLVEARRRFGASEIGGSADFGQLPLILLLGPRGSTKTTSVLHSGLSPELLAGDVFRGEAVVPTPGANVWYANETVLVEAGGGLLDDPTLWSRLLRLVQPKRFAAAVTGGGQAPRAAVVFFSCEEFLRPDASQTVPAAARMLRQRLVDAAQELGIRLPVYVIFSKADRIPYFEDYVRHFTLEEARQVLGETLRLPEGDGDGTYAQRERRRLEGAFQRILHSLALKRLKFLPRETVGDRVRSAYEFPREMQKLMPLALDFLVDLCRPSQLQVSPFLRGFYFAGVRPVVVSGGAEPAAPLPGGGPGAPSRVDATLVFDPSAAGGAGAVGPAPGTPGSRRVPQWVFLERVFGTVVLKDRVAMAAAGGGVRVNMLRRLFLGLAVAASVVILAGVTTSFVANKALQGRTRGAMESVLGVGAPPGTLATTEQIALLDTLRMETARLLAYEREGRPLRLRWGLYSGSKFSAAAREAYFAAFDRILFHRVRAALLRGLEGIPDTPDETSDYGSTYDLLKTYLITTVNPDESTPEFLVGPLIDLWRQGQSLEEEYLELAARQMEFYASELPHGNPFDLEADQLLVTRARRFLWAFGEADPFYRSLVSSAGRGIPPIRFGELVPGSGRLLSVQEEIPGAFTARGWEEVQSRLARPEELLQTEEWVLGQEAPTPDPAELAIRLRAMYEAEYRDRWLRFLATASVVPFTDARDGAVKLGALSGSDSPLLRLFYLTAEQTAVGSPELEAAFQPVTQVTPFDSSQSPLNEVNQPYRMALGMLGSALDEAAGASGEELAAARQQVRAAMRQAQSASQQIATGFAGTPESRVAAREVLRILEGPVNQAGRAIEGTFRGRFAQQVRPLCQEIDRILGLYPFSGNPASPAATLDDLDAAFQPEGSALWTVFNDHLQPLLDRRGSSFVSKRDAPFTLTPAFIRAFNRAAEFSNALYSSPSAGPRISFTFRPRLSEAVEEVTLIFAGESFRFTRTSSVTATVDWDGRRAGETRLLARINGVERTLAGPFDDPWAIFRLFQQAEGWDPTGPRHTVRWSVSREGQEAVLTADVELLGMPSVFRRDYFAGMRCPQRVVQ